MARLILRTRGIMKAVGAYLPDDFPKREGVKRKKLNVSAYNSVQTLYPSRVPKILMMVCSSAGNSLGSQLEVCWSLWPKVIEKNMA